MFSQSKRNFLKTVAGAAAAYSIVKILPAQSVPEPVEIAQTGFPEFVLQIESFPVTKDRPFDYPAWRARWLRAPKHMRDKFLLARSRRLPKSLFDKNPKDFLWYPEEQTSDQPAYLVFAMCPWYKNYPENGIRRGELRVFAASTAV